MDGCPFCLSKHLKNTCQVYLWTTILSKAYIEKKTKYSHQGRTVDIKCNTNSTANQPFPKRTKPVKFYTDKTQLRYSYVPGEIDISDCNTNENNNETDNNEMHAYIDVMVLLNLF